MYFDADASLEAVEQVCAHQRRPAPLGSVVIGIVIGWMARGRR